MTQMALHDLQCAHCGNTQETMIYSSLNVTLDPELKEKLYAAEVNVLECEECEEKTWFSAPLLYHDMTAQIYVQFYDPDLLDDPDFLRQFNSDGSLDIKSVPVSLPSSGDYLRRPHIVFDMGEMLRYVKFRDSIASAAYDEPSPPGEEEIPF